MNLNSESLNIVGTVRTTSEVGQVELDLVPALVQAHWHGADEGLHTSRRLVVRSAESASNVLVIENLHFESEVLFQLWVRELKFEICNLHSL